MYNLIVEHLGTILAVGSGLIGVVVWFVRLEGRINMQDNIIQDAQADIKDLRIRHEALDSKVLEKISQIQQAVARIEGMLEAKNIE